MSLKRPKERTYYKVFVTLNDSYYMAKIGGQWQMVGVCTGVSYGSSREACELPHLQAVRNALKSTLGQRFLKRGAKYVITKHVVTIVEDTFAGPLEQLARCADDE